MTVVVDKKHVMEEDRIKQFVQDKIPVEVTAKFVNPTTKKSEIFETRLLGIDGKWILALF